MKRGPGATVGPSDVTTLVSLLGGRGINDYHSPPSVVRACLEDATDLRPARVLDTASPNSQVRVRHLPDKFHFSGRDK
jgi:hypothetical protein